MDIALDLDKTSLTFEDILVQNGDLVLVDGKTAIQQHILQRIRIFLAEWFLDNTIGLPYFQSILVKNPDQTTIDALFQNQILGTPGVITLAKYSFVPNFLTRQLQLSFSVITTDGLVDYSGLVSQD